MKRFRFRLERLLGLREAAEQDRARSLGTAARAAAHARELADASARQCLAAQQQISRALGAPLPAGLVSSLAASLARIATTRDVHEQASSEADAAHSDALTDYQQAHRERRVLERLSEIRRGVHEVEAAREERRQMDEVAAQFGRRQQEHS
ncbi:MAG TPA: flagellar export protein FliJ [Gemmatimonadales bacterium]|nr:flagellar export protein FliJ [Gemmatimonadales bacterium]